MTVTETGLDRLGERHRPSLSERWLSTALDKPVARGYIEFVLDVMFGAGYLDPPRLTDPTGPFVRNRRRRPGFGASLITGRGGRGSRATAPDAHIEVRLYAEDDGSTTVYLGVAALCCRHPRRWEARLLDAFERRWQTLGDTSLRPVASPGYAI